MDEADKISVDDIAFLNSISDEIVHLSEKAYGPKDSTDGPRSLERHRTQSVRIKSIALRLEKRLSA